ncbi:MAG: hypothetical protein Q8P89_01400 [bacterium]|nr:hypothetical protein [bacterium]
MEKESVPSGLERINWPDHVTSEQLVRMVSLCQLKNTRVVVADEIEAEGLVLRGAIEQRFGSQDYQLPMVGAYARIGREVRWADDGLKVWRQDLERGYLTPIPSKQRYLLALLKDPRGFELLEKLVLERSDGAELSLSEVVGFTAGVSRYCRLYEALIAAGVKPKESEERFYPPIAGGARPLLHRRKDIPKEYTVAEEIVKNTVLVDEEGDYHVLWDKSHYYFHDLQAVLYNHDRVIENYQGILITIGERVLEIEGEIPQAARLANRLSMISAGFRDAGSQTPETRQKLWGELGELRDEIGQVRNELKRQGKDKIIIASSTTQPEVAGKKTREAAGDFLDRAVDAAAKLEGALERKEKVVQKREEWERKIVRSYSILGVYLSELETRKVLTLRFLQSMSLQIASGQKNISVDLQGIPGQPYKQRMETPEIKNLGQIPEAVQKGDFLLTKRILREAIKMLKPVVDEKAARERAAKNTF